MEFREKVYKMIKKVRRKINKVKRKVKGDEKRSWMTMQKCPDCGTMLMCDTELIWCMYVKCHYHRKAFTQ